MIGDYEPLSGFPMCYLSVCVKIGGEIGSNEKSVSDAG